MRQTTINIVESTSFMSLKINERKKIYVKTPHNTLTLYIKLIKQKGNICYVTASKPTYSIYKYSKGKYSGLRFEHPIGLLVVCSIISDIMF